MIIKVRAFENIHGWVITEQRWTGSDMGLMRLHMIDSKTVWMEPKVRPVSRAHVEVW